MRRTSLLLLALAVGCTDADAPTTTTAESHLLSTAKIDAALAAALASSPPGARHRVVITLDGTRSASAVAAAVAGLGGGTLGFARLPLVAARLTTAQVALVRSLAGVKALYLDRPLQLMLAQSRATIFADQVHGLGVTGSGVGVAVLDSGVDGTHPGLSYPSKTVQNVKLLAAPDELFGSSLLGRDLLLENLPDTDTTTGHGTHCAGIVAGDGGGGTYAGVAPGAKIVGIGVGDGINILWALSGIDWILEHRAQYNIRVVNNSWGTTGAFDAGDPINLATRAMHDAGITVVFAAGNEGSAPDTLNPYSVAPWVIGVAAGCKTGADPTSSASECNDGRSQLLADFSSRGVPGDEVYHPTVTAPGVHIVSARSKTGTVMNALDLQADATTCAIPAGDVLGYTCASGTSMAAPHVAGIVALMLEANPSLTPDEIKDVLRVTARPMPGYGEWEVGAGYVDALAAVDAVD